MLNTQRKKIVIGMMAAFVIAAVASTQIFWNNTIALNPLFISRLKAIPSGIVEFAKDPFYMKEYNENAKYNATVFQNLPTANTEIPKNAVYKAVNKGIQMATDPVTKKSYAVFDNSTKYKVNKIELNGKQYNIIVPQ
jgi:hypothetical protein